VQAYQLDRPSPMYSWWLIWQPGQTWYAALEAVSEPGTSHPRPSPATAHAFADALASSAWHDCSATAT
jgi:hypothetical protein